jgi:hypothetical protein
VSAAWDAKDVSATLRGLFDLRVELSGIAKDVQSIGRPWMTMKKKKPKTAKEFLAQDPVERYEETQRILAERIGYHERKVAEIERERASR